MFFALKSEGAGFDNHGAQFHGTAAVMFIEMYEPKLPLRQRRLKERHHLLAWKPMHTAEIKDGTDETAPA